MMEQEYYYLVTLSRAYLNGETAELRGDIDYFKLYKIAILFCVINTSANKTIVPAEAFQRFEDDFFEAVIRYDMQAAIAKELDAVLSAAGIRHVFFKGAELNEYYPVPQARVMGDIDVLISRQDRDAVKALLVKNGFQLVNSNGPVYDYSKDGFKIEMHTKIISGKVGNADAEQCFLDAINYAAFDGFTGRLETSYHFAYLITHIAHHFWFYGAGVKLILDLAVMMKRFDIDLAAVMDKLSEEGLKEFAEVVLTVCHQWFGTAPCYHTDTKKTEQFLLSFGAFGNINRNRAAVIERKELEEGKKTSSFMTRLRLLFPSYNHLKNIPYIRFIEGRPYLLPYAWVYRIIYNFKYKKEYVKTTTKKIGSDETNSDAQNELAYFKEIGLL